MEIDHFTKSASLQNDQRKTLSDTIASEQAHECAKPEPIR